MQIARKERQIAAQSTVADCPSQETATTFGQLKWTLTRMDYTEWIYGLDGILNLNGGKVSLKTLFEIFNPIFGIKDFQYSNYFAKIASRKKDGKKSVFDLEREHTGQRKEKSDNK